MEPCGGLVDKVRRPAGEGHACFHSVAYMQELGHTWRGQKKTMQTWACVVGLGSWLGLAAIGPYGGLGLACAGSFLGPELGLKWVIVVELGQGPTKTLKLQQSIKNYNIKISSQLN